MPTSLLLAEDDSRLLEDLQQHFLNRSFLVHACASGTQALQAVQHNRFDLVLLDIMLPGIDGLSLLDEIRRQQAVPVMLMSALGAEQDRISGFTRGADDYLPKPFSLAELDARVDALLRRVAFDRATSLHTEAGEVILDQELQDIHHNGKAAGLTASEFRLLATLNAHPGEALSKAFLYQTVLHRAYTRLDRGLDVHVCNLRRKLADIGAQHLQIQAVRGQGYILIDKDQP
ncbi:response regulator transcription factor [Pseudomonas sp. GD03860]|uniref:response regulator transcription factor n=1 Tax=Pseudomonas TaxID=286 RepID=UPI0023632BFB|nr:MULTISPECIES: response regulator transcription factor [Pseudomonas]MDD2057443.1 response regulator transcription factor [Pseudomonas putida]MDH0635756.1 response regulator transcription factor [Pseudomonas sp. GD03860]